jgi:hypothetical protein
MAGSGGYIIRTAFARAVVPIGEIPDDDRAESDLWDMMVIFRQGWPSQGELELAFGTENRIGTRPASNERKRFCGMPS